MATQASPYLAPAVTKSEGVTALALIVAHVVLAAAMRSIPSIATVHAIATAGLGIAYAVVTRRLRNLVFVVAYIVGCEVLWRMSRAAVFYEFGKYAVLAICAIGALKTKSKRNSGLSLVFIALLLPSAAVTFTQLDFELARQQVGFTLAGPVAIAVAVLFFSNVQLSVVDLWRAFIAFIAPTAGIAAITIFTTRANELDFGNGSNVVTSGGFGPNQVSAMLGLSTLFLVLIAFERRLPTRYRYPALGLAIGFAALSALTFSRGGVVLALLSASVAMFRILRGSRRGRITVAFATVLMLIVGRYVVEPRLEEFTGGKLSERYLNTQSSGRDVYAASELEMFQQHPILGVGAGIGAYEREQNGMVGAASHTEYTRLLGEHGLLGVLDLALLFVMFARALYQNSDSLSKSYAGAFVVWVSVFLLIYSTRLAAPAFVLGLAYTRRKITTTTPGVRGAALVAPSV